MLIDKLLLKLNGRIIVLLRSVPLLEISQNKCSVIVHGSKFALVIRDIGMLLEQFCLQLGSSLIVGHRGFRLSAPRAEQSQITKRCGQSTAVLWNFRVLLGEYLIGIARCFELGLCPIPFTEFGQQVSQADTN